MYVFVINLHYLNINFQTNIFWKKLFKEQRKKWFDLNINVYFYIL